MFGTGSNQKGCSGQAGNSESPGHKKFRDRQESPGQAGNLGAASWGQAASCASEVWDRQKVSQGETELDAVALVLHFAADNRQINFGVRYLFFAEGKDVLGEDDDVRELAWGQRAFEIFLECRDCVVDGVAA